MGTSGQGASVMDKQPVRTEFPQQGTHFEGYSPGRTPSETTGSFYSFGLMERSTGGIPLVFEMRRWIEESHESLGENFQTLAHEWKRDTGHLSIVAQIVSHPSYQGIVAIGAPAIPLILRDLAAEPNHWFPALRAITGGGPDVPAGIRGDMKAISKVWLDWGKEKNYID